MKYERRRWVDITHDYFVSIPAVTPEEHKLLELIRLCHILKLCEKLIKLLELFAGKQLKQTEDHPEE